MKYCCLSPCFIAFENVPSQTLAVNYFIENINFILNYLDITPCFHENSIYQQKNWFQKPLHNFHADNAMKTVGYKALHRLIKNSRTITKNICIDATISGEYLTVDQNEINRIMTCMEEINDDVLNKKLVKENNKIWQYM